MLKHKLREKTRWVYFSDLLADEFDQCRREGRNVEAFHPEVEALLAEPPSAEKEAKAKELVLLLEAQPMLPSFPYTEPSSYGEIIAELPKESKKSYGYDKTRLQTKVKGAWYGRLAGCLLGIPVEDWPRVRIRNFLRDSGQAPLQNYMTGRVSEALRETYGVNDYDPGTPYDRQTTCWIEFIKGFPVDDDINYMLLGLKVLERFGKHFDSSDMAETWLFSMAGFQACTSERVAYRNLMNGVLPPESARFGNPFREWIGAQIRADLFGYVAPGNPRLAAKMACEDAAVSHVKNGVYGEMFVAAVLSLCYTSLAMEDIIQTALLQIPPKSRLYAAVSDVLARYQNGEDYADVVDAIHAKYDEAHWFDWCSVFPNAMLVAAGVLYWHGDYSAAITNTVLCGFDTDCNGATVGSIVGLYNGFEAIGEKWYRGIEPTVSSGVHGYGRMTVDEAIKRTCALVNKE